MPTLLLCPTSLTFHSRALYTYARSPFDHLQLVGRLPLSPCPARFTIHSFHARTYAPMPDQSLTPGQALGRWILHVVVFLLSGGVAAGASALAYQAIAQTQTPLGIYAVIFAAGGFIAYRQTERVLATEA
ncbi:Hypothetical protein SRM_00045 [Salinibacter ruber M8]|uniref:Uncharacterized protein n=2 Tax=Salinibacter ruber TaxID=146919 RepID=D5H4L1_SALRM|nr:Hypothetical protein SRM_00045 [Salinibacter ruber M8]